MMAKAKTVFFCTNCGNESPKWQGRCPACGAWNTYEEHIEKPTLPGKAKSSPVGQSRKPQRIQDVTTDGEIRFSTGMGELDRVLGGGAVAGSWCWWAALPVLASLRCCCKSATACAPGAACSMSPARKVSGS